MATETDRRGASHPWPFISRADDAPTTLDDAMRRMSITGRRAQSSPEIQNFPGTPAASMEMLYARLGAPNRHPDR